MSNSSSISPTISSNISSIVTKPATRPNSSMTTARWLRLPWKSVNKSFNHLLSGTKTAGRNMARMLCSGARYNLSKSLASKIPMMFSRSPSNTGKREWPASMTPRSKESKGSAIFTKSIRVVGTMTSPAVMSAMRSTPSSIRRDSAPMMLFCSASTKVSISSSVESGPG